MPVIETDVHPSTVQKPHYGCKDRRIVDGYWVKAGLMIEEIDGQVVALYKMKWQPHVLSTACRYDGRGEDMRCAGCKVVWDLAHVRRQEREGK